MKSLRILLICQQALRRHAVPAYSFWETYFKQGLIEAGHSWIEGDEIDWAEALDGVLTQAFARKAEVCFAGSRLYLPRRMEAEFVAELAAKAARIPLGDPLDPATQLGPLMTPQRVEDILTLVKDSVKRRRPRLLRRRKGACTRSRSR